MSAYKESAVADDPLEVLFALHPKFDLLDFAGSWEVFKTALQDLGDSESTAFDCTIAYDEPKVLSEQDVIVGSQIPYKEAYKHLNKYDVLVVVGGNVAEVAKKEAEPVGLIKAFVELQESDPKRERTLMSVCTGSLFFATAGILPGLSATTHPDYIREFDELCIAAAQRDLDDPTDVLEDTRYVVNNLRFELGDVDDNPYVHRKSDAGGDRRPSMARKGSVSMKGSVARVSSIKRRETMRLGGLRVITSGGVTAGIDAALYLVAALVSDESAIEVARVMQWDWKKGTVVDGLDV